MAADRFTQVANGLFRDSRISYRAKGIFGCISTHRNGWPVTVAALAAVGPDGRDAVRAGLRELERFGYLVRDRVRRADGTLGGSVYSITDRPAAPDDAASTVQAPAGDAGFGAGIRSVSTVRESAVDADAGFGSGVRRGVMAPDRFTQIANMLFRDSRLSFKAKGLFGSISTHRDGWQVTVASLARQGRERVDAVTTGLQELEHHRFLLRDRDRNTDGTLGPARYVITDLPALQHRSSPPQSGYPGWAEPALADPGTKNTIIKKTNQQKTTPIRPYDHTAARTNPRTAAQHAPPLSKPPAADEIHAGIRLLLDIGASRPELLLTGPALTDQGRVATVMLQAGWSPEQLRHVITGRPLPSLVRTSIGAIIAARLRAAQAYPPPATVTAAVRHGTLPPDERFVAATGPRSSTTAVDRSVSDALAYRALVECTGCGVPATAPGEDLCPSCLGWPLCRTCPGPTRKRAHPDGDGRCTTCAST